VTECYYKYDNTGLLYKNNFKSVYVNNKKFALYLGKFKYRLRH